MDFSAHSGKLGRQLRGQCLSTPYQHRINLREPHGNRNRSNHHIDVIFNGTLWRRVNGNNCPLNHDTIFDRCFRCGCAPKTPCLHQWAQAPTIIAGGWHVAFMCSTLSCICHPHLGLYLDSIRCLKEKRPARYSSVLRTIYERNIRAKTHSCY